MVENQFIGGSWKKSHSSLSFEQRNPANLDEVTGVWPRGDLSDARDAIEAAAAAYHDWSRLPAVKRGDLFRAALHALDRRSEEIAEVITKENGKTLTESRAEVRAAYREMEYQIDQGVRLEGRMRPSTRAGVVSYETRVPRGVVSVIAPWNFPLNVPARKITPALMTGNTVVFKPAALTPRVGKLFTEILAEAGFPAGVINFVVGEGSTVGREFTTAPEVRAISFTGSTEVGRSIHRVAAEQMIPTQLEMGGKNAMVVLSDADLERALRSAVTAGYACAGQWCTSTSRVVVEAPVYDEFCERLAARVVTLKTGDGTDPAVDMGPVCGVDQVETITGYIDVGRREGARLIVGGEKLSAGLLAAGCFVTPTVFADVSPNMRIAQEEIFGPVLSLLKAADFDDAVRLANAVPFGLSSSVYTRDLGRAFAFVEQIETGLVHVNMITAYREPALSFGGVKASGYGLPEAGDSAVAFFTEHKVVYVQHDSDAT